MAIKAPKIHDYDNKIDIWENPDYFSNKSKLDHMDIDYEANRFDVTVNYSKKIIGQEFDDISKLADTFTYQYEIKAGYVSDNFDDIPFIIPYLVENPKVAVLLLAGGGFAYKTIHGNPNAGRDIALRLNQNGISAFVLDYRTNPYKFPVPMLDLQRAIRFLRYHSERFGINPKKITILGFSAGGYVVGAFVNQYMGKDRFSENYVKDEIDEVSDNIESAGYIYPNLTFNYNVPMICAVAEKIEFTNLENRNSLLDRLDLSKHISNNIDYHFISYSNGDLTCDHRGTEEYIKAVKDKGQNVHRIFVPNQDHGYSNEEFLDEYVNWINFVY